MKAIKQLRTEGKPLEPIIRIGKEGLNDKVIGEIMKVLKKRKLIKIRILKSSKESKGSIIDEISEKTGSVLVEKVGSVAVIYKD
ncbi:YhbY family RNA-binding protein [Candidatus Woesearchaeota archaeon]|nr:YhbY family RNA-binding protein [Candidatus Woesearchaeota archaeon]MBI2661278.1 YhbY family RNA-binding protein [Candidatus Woesearchaeota archaeon]